MEQTNPHGQKEQPTTPTPQEHMESGMGLDPHLSASESSSQKGEAAGPTDEDVEREVADAMRAMSEADLAELSGGLQAETRAQGREDAESIPAGTELTGTVVGYTDEEVFLEIGSKVQAVVPRSQFGKKEAIDLGRRIDVAVDRYDPDESFLIVNRKGAIQRATWTNLSKGMIVEGVVTGMNKGGLEATVNGLRAFMPASQVHDAPMKDISVLIGHRVTCEVMEVDRRHKTILLSRRRVLEREAAERRERLKAELEVGQIRQGVVGNVTDFGAFVDLGGLDGLIHIRDLSWGTVEKASDVVQPGQEVTVKVLKIDSKRGRISLGLRQAQPDPWQGIEERFPIGATTKVRVVRLADFGAFAELEPGVDGLIPISEAAWSRIRNISEVVSAGSVVDAKVIRVEPQKRRIALSLKQAQPDPWAEVAESYPVNSVVKGTVTRLADFGAFVELAPGVEGLVHISELSDRRIKTCKEVVDAGQEVEARVLGVDTDSRRISLSIKALAAPVVDAAAAPETSDRKAPEKAKKRKKQLRGGLASHWDWHG